MADEKETPTGFRPCVDEGYEVNSMGVVRNSKTGRVLKRSMINGYPSVSLGGGREYLVHRLVALAWLPPPDDPAKIHVNHGDETNCDVSNLEWTTPAENTQHPRNTGLIAKTEEQQSSQSTRRATPSSASQ